jgi:hypothetical protein
MERVGSDRESGAKVGANLNWAAGRSVSTSQRHGEANVQMSGTSKLRCFAPHGLMKRSTTFIISCIYCLQRQRAFPESLSSFKYPPAYGVDFPLVPTLAYI